MARCQSDPRTFGQELRAAEGLPPPDGSLTERELDWLIAQINLRAEEQLLDLGCGSGALTLALVEKTHCRAIGIDLMFERSAFAQARARCIPQQR